MTPRSHTAVRIDDELREAMRLLEEREGIPMAEQIRRGIRMFLESKAVRIKAKPTTRKKKPRA